MAKTHQLYQTCSQSSKEGCRHFETEKLLILQEMMDCLRHVICPSRHEVDSYTNDCIRDSTIPTTQTELRSLIGFCDGFRQFVLNSARIASSLTARLRK